MNVRIDADRNNRVKVFTQAAKPPAFGGPEVFEAVVLDVGEVAHHLPVELKPDEARIAAQALVAAADELDATIKAREQEGP